MSNRRLILIIVLLFFAAVAGTIFFRAISTDDADSDTEQVETLQVDTAGLAPVIPQLPSITEENINTALMGVIRMNIPEPKNSYEAVYRKSSIENKQSSTGAPIVTFLVDVPELQRTFRIEIEGNDDTPSKTIYALCPLPGQSAYGERECNDTP